MVKNRVSQLDIKKEKNNYIITKICWDIILK